MTSLELWGRGDALLMYGGKAFTFPGVQVRVSWISLKYYNGPLAFRQKYWQRSFTFPYHELKLTFVGLCMVYVRMHVRIYNYKFMLTFLSSMVEAWAKLHFWNYGEEALRVGVWSAVGPFLDSPMISSNSLTHVITPSPTSLHLYGTNGWWGHRARALVLALWWGGNSSPCGGVLPIEASQPPQNGLPLTLKTEYSNESEKKLPDHR